VTILRDPAGIRYQNIRSIAIPGMRSRGYAPTGYQDYSRGIRGLPGDFMTAVQARTPTVLFGVGAGAVVGVGIGLGLGFLLWRKRR
jgi:hypothetical protein